MVGERRRPMTLLMAAVLLATGTATAACDDEPSATGLVIPESDPSTWPPGVLGGQSEEERAATLEVWGERAECSPFSLMIDYDDGLLSPEEYTAYALYAMAPYLPRTEASPVPELPERYVLCPGPEAFQGLGFAMGLFLEDIDPVFRDELWLQVMGQTYTEAHRPVTEEEVDEALRRFDDGSVNQP